MKKFVALLLAMLLVLANVAALAEDGNDDTTQVTQTSGMGIVLRGAVEGKGSATKPVIVKKYTIEGQAAGTAAISFQETLTFTVKATEGPVTNRPMITLGNYSIPEGETGEEQTVVVTVGNNISNDIDINLPSASAYKTAGLYKYTIKEKDGTTQGMQYDIDKETVNVWVYVKWNDNHTAFETPVANVFITQPAADQSQKSEDITNNYQVGSLTVQKQVTGNLADPDKPFTIEVTFKQNVNVKSPVTIITTEDAQADVRTISPDDFASNNNKVVTLTLKGNEKDTVTFQNLPYGVEYTIVEKDITGKQTFIPEEQQAEEANDPTAYTKSNEITTFTKIEDATVIKTITNKKEFTPPQTGITLETLPYVLIMAIAVMGVAVLTLRKREEY